jgi:hypothetical protein
MKTENTTLLRFLKHRGAKVLRWAASVFLLAFVLSACTPTSIPVVVAPPSTTPFEVSEIKDKSWASIKVLKPLTALQPTNPDTGSIWYKLVDSGYVTTDSSGIAKIQNTSKGCYNIYVFKQSSILLGTCSPSSASGWVCTVGSTSFNKCSVSVQTVSSDILPNGTWYSVITLDEGRVTIVSVMDGEVTVVPVIKIDSTFSEDPEDRAFSYTINRRDVAEDKRFVLGKGQGGFTASEDDLVRLREEAASKNLPLPEAGVALDSKGFQQLIKTFVGLERYPQLLPWILEVRDASMNDVGFFLLSDAELDEITRPGGNIQPPDIILGGLGSWLEDPARQEAVLQGVNWLEIQPIALAGQPANLIFQLPQREGLLVDQPFSLDLSQKIVNEGALDKEPVTLLVPAGDLELLALAERLVNDLNIVGIPVEIEQISGSELVAYAQTGAAAGMPYLWLQRP